MTRPLLLHELDRRRALSNVDRAALDEWRAHMTAKVCDFIRENYIKTDFASIGDLDRRGLHDDLMDALSDATHEAWERME